MAKVVKKLKQKPNNEQEEAIKRDAMALATLLYDIYREKKQKERADANLS